MKKIMMTAAALMAAVTMFAEPEMNENKAVVNKYDINFNNASIAKFLGASFNQEADMSMVHKNFAKEMKKAENTSDETKKAKLTKKAVLNDIAYMRLVLSESQFRKYRTVLNATMNNRGIEY